MKALPLALGLPKLDTAWDNLFNFSVAGVLAANTANALDTLKSQPSLLGRVLSTPREITAEVVTAAAASGSVSSSGVTPESSKKKSFFSRLKG